MAASTKVSASIKKAAKKKTLTAAKFKTVSEYIAALPTAKKSIVKEIRRTIQQVSPTAEEMISYNMPAFKLNGKGLIWYAAWEEHISLYPRTRILEGAIKELADYGGAKGTIKFLLTQPMPFDIIRRIVTVRMQEIKKAK